jgi:hypothetical protein
MRHAVLGAGGVGGLVSGALAQAGHSVTLLVRPGRRRYYPQVLSVESKTLGWFEVPVRVTERFDEPFDIVWITVKATALKAALHAVPEQELRSGLVVPLLNGIDHGAKLRQLYGPERVLPGTIRVEAEQLEPGRVRQLSSFVNVGVAPNLTTLTRAEVLCSELRAAGLSCEVQDDEVTMLWSKLCFLAPFALATPASGGVARSCSVGRGLEYTLGGGCQGGLRCWVSRGCRGRSRTDPRSTRRGTRRLSELDAKGCGRGTGAGARCHRGAHSPWWQQARDRGVCDSGPRASHRRSYVKADRWVASGKGCISSSRRSPLSPPWYLQDHFVTGPIWNPHDRHPRSRLPSRQKYRFCRS